jgi:hypothetical protein
MSHSLWSGRLACKTADFRPDACNRKAIVILTAIIAIAVGLRGFQLGRLSFWYDEVVTMRLAEAGDPGALLSRLMEIDATRAPLHPLLLAAWIRIMGHSEAAARGFSVVCGIATIVLVFDLGRTMFGSGTGLWAAWLAAISPPLVAYAREARMYAWLVLLTCLCWRLLVGLRRSYTVPKAGAYAALLTALIYSHPLGLLMVGALALATLISGDDAHGSWRRWLAVYLVVGAATAPWIGNYFDHPPEFLTGPLPIRFLLATPIGFIGGNSWVLLGLVVLIGWGLVHQLPIRDRDGARRIDRTKWLHPAFLLLWLSVPPTMLYIYSRVVQPVFGPPRYTLFVGPAYLLLVALGLARTSALVQYPLALGLTVLAASELGPKVYDPELKADWRGFAASLAARPSERGLVIVASTNSTRNTEVETARYYLPAAWAAIALEEATADRLDRIRPGTVYLAVGSHREVLAVPVPEQLWPYRFIHSTRFPGLLVFRARE